MTSTASASVESPILQQETRAEQYVGGLRWVLHGFSSLPNAYPTSMLTSRTFEVGGHPLCVLLYPGGHHMASLATFDGRPFMAWFVKNLSDHDLQVAAEIQVIGRDSKTIVTSSFASTTIAAPLNLGRVGDLKKDVIAAGAAENGDAVTLIVTVTVFSMASREEATGLDISKAKMQCLGDDMKRLLDSAAHSDIQLAVGGCTFAAHKAILTARSPVFAAMLASNMQESKSGLVEICNMEPSVVKELLHFIYVGCLSSAAQMPNLAGAIASSSPSVVAEKKRLPGSASSSSAETCAMDPFDAAISAAMMTARASLASSLSLTTELDASCVSFKQRSLDPAEVYFHDDASVLEIKRETPVMAAETLIAHLLVAADRFEISSLVDTCTKIIMFHLNVDNFVNMLIFADRHHSAALKVAILCNCFDVQFCVCVCMCVCFQAHCVKFIKMDKGRFNKVKQTAAYKSLDKDLLYLLLEALSVG